MKKRNLSPPVKILKKTEEYFNKIGAKLICFDYYRKVFGNIVIEIEHLGIVHRCTLDRSEIYFDNKFICILPWSIQGEKVFEEVLNIIGDQLKYKETK